MPFDIIKKFGKETNTIENPDEPIQPEVCETLSKIIKNIAKCQACSASFSGRLPFVIKTCLFISLNLSISERNPICFLALEFIFNNSFYFLNRLFRMAFVICHRIIVEFFETYFLFGGLDSFLDFAFSYSLPNQRHPSYSILKRRKSCYVPK